MLMGFAKRWHLETSSLHLLHDELTVTLDDISCLLHIPIRGTLLRHGRMTKENVREMLVEELGTDPLDALEEVDKTREAHVRFSFLTRRFGEALIAARQADDGPVEVEIQRQHVLRCYFLFLVGTQLFVDTSSIYTNVAYFRYFLDSIQIHEYNWGAATLAYMYSRLGEGGLWKTKTMAGDVALLVAWIFQHFPMISGWGSVPD
ncbi:unnamed protein product [Lathyrus sativus]|nr:unnamed protein product [Lathyrus sativus]